MALAYTEKQIVQYQLHAELRATILLSTDWADITPTRDVNITTVNAATAIGATTITVVDSTPLAIGQVIVVDRDTVNEERLVISTKPNATSITVPAGQVRFAHAVAATIRTGQILLKATTTRGAQMVVDLAKRQDNGNGIQIAVWRTHTGTVGVDEVVRFVKYGSGVRPTNAIVRIRVSAGKERIYFDVEGPRLGETGYEGTSSGSQRHSFTLCDIAPYHVVDTIPAVCLVAHVNDDHDDDTPYVQVSRNYQDNSSWVRAWLHTLTIPGRNIDFGPGLYRAGAIAPDGNAYLFPWVVIEDGNGLRGRLSGMYFGGVTRSVTHYGVTYVGQSEGAEFTVEGQRVRLMFSDKGGFTNVYTTNGWGYYNSAPNSEVAGALVAVPVV